MTRRRAVTWVLILGMVASHPVLAAEPDEEVTVFGPDGQVTRGHRSDSSNSKTLLARAASLKDAGAPWTAWALLMGAPEDVRAEHAVADEIMVLQAILAGSGPDPFVGANQLKLLEAKLNGLAKERAIVAELNRKLASAAEVSEQSAEVEIGQRSEESPAPIEPVEVVVPPAKQSKPVRLADWAKLDANPAFKGVTLTAIRTVPRDRWVGQKFLLVGRNSEEFDGLWRGPATEESKELTEKASAAMSMEQLSAAITRDLSGSEKVPVAELEGRVGTVIEYSQRSREVVTLRMDDDGSLYHAENNAMCFHLLRVAEVIAAKRSLKGKQLWCKGPTLASFVAYRGGKPVAAEKTATLKNTSAITVVDVSAGNDPNTPIDLFIKASDGALMTCSVTIGETTTCLPESASPISEVFFLDDPRRRYAWPARVWRAIEDERVFVGMTAEQARMSWGEPKDVNRTTIRYGRHEQWVYGNGNYLYFDNGILSSYQN